jgi:hypothetical protein
MHAHYAEKCDSIIDELKYGTRKFRNLDIHIQKNQRTKNIYASIFLCKQSERIRQIK